MWSNLYNYYNIQSDDLFSEKIEKAKVVDVLLRTSCFQKIDNQLFTNSNNFHWIRLSIHLTEDGNYASNNEDLE